MDLVRFEPPIVAADAITIAIQAFPDRSATQIASQVGCTDRYVGGTGSNYFEPVPPELCEREGRKDLSGVAVDALRQAAEHDTENDAGGAASAVVIRKTLDVGPEDVARVRRDIGRCRRVVECEGDHLVRCCARGLVEGSRRYR